MNLDYNTRNREANKIVSELLKDPTLGGIFPKTSLLKIAWRLIFKKEIPIKIENFIMRFGSDWQFWRAILKRVEQITSEKKREKIEILIKFGDDLVAKNQM